MEKRYEIRCVNVNDCTYVVVSAARVCDVGALSKAGSSVSDETAAACC